MTNPNHNLDEDRLAQLLRASQHPPLEPDEQWLARLRAESTDVFQSSPPENKTTPLARNSKMFIYVWRTLAAMVIAVVAATWFMASESGAITLAKVLEKTEAAAALHLRIQRADRPAGKPASHAQEAWSARGEKLRVNRPDGTYDIAQKEKLWQIDEKANRATSGASPYYRRDTKSLDLLPLVGLSTFSALAARPVHEMIGDKLYDVYRFETTADGRSLWIEARVDPATQLLHSLETLVDRDGKRTPAVTLTVLDANQPVNEDLFVVGDSLSEDGRIGKVTDVQGMVSIKPAMAERWTPVSGNLLLKPRDWLRTDLRGANAAAARLTSKVQIVAGPGTLVELVSPKSIRLYEGQIKIAPEAKTPLKLLGPDQKSIDVTRPGVYRVEKETLALLKEDPKWLKGFEGTEVQESIGSLVATVDGRNVPLTVGYHKVTVEIRDQIARTTVEESFANMTDARLEGVFYFPLPQDASISGFGMWIGNELVDADIVEKQRAREIYETILREKRDPGLLEWSGGNLFKARVFPIEAHAEKRIHIVYTQVLPLVGNSYRYSYALQSEMLKQHPLRELSIDVKINSAVPLKKVASPTHAARNDQTAHSAHVEFSAQEYTPTRDFEVVAELDGGAGVSPALAAGPAAPLTLIPHRRGDDGYFMLMLTPPPSGNEDDRDLLIDKTPLDLILLADTSASLDAGQRARQAEFIAAMLQSLTPRDTVNLACFDVACDWAFEKAVPADAKNLEIARKFLDRRASLGWTDLAKAFRQAFERAGRNTCIVYVGDGIPTVGDADPAAAAAQLRRLYAEKWRAGVPALAGMPAKAGTPAPVCHAVAVGSTFESGVLKAIGSLGGGSMRQITGEQGPRAVALDLLKEITRPALRNLKLQFSGLQVARVYPEQLPNLPGGSQQIVLGRYLPQGKEQSGQVIVTGQQGDREIRFEKAVSLADAEQGNSFIPRLWARMHLDYLLQQGATPTIKDDIIALSEDYHIITPYTSLLVLESDADRERFKVKRGFTMRDGEKFFAVGRDNANFELTQQQMRRAGSWRLGMRMAVLKQLSGLGRNIGAFQQGGAYGHAMYGISRGPSQTPFVISVIPVDESGGGGRLGLWGENSYAGLTKTGAGTLIGNGTVYFFNSSFDGRDRAKALADREELDVDQLSADSPVAACAPVPNGPANAPADSNGDDLPLHSDVVDLTGEDQGGKQEAGESYDGEDSKQSLGLERPDPDVVPMSGEWLEKKKSLRFLVTEGHNTYTGGTTIGGGALNLWNSNSWAQQRVWPYSSNGEVENWLNSLFGTLPPAPAGKKSSLPKPAWPEEIFTLSKNLLRTSQFTLADGGLQFDTESDSFDPRFAELTSQSSMNLLAGASGWLIRSAADGGQTTVQWCDGKERGIFNRSFQLGRLRKAIDAERSSPPASLNGFVLTSLQDTFAYQKVSISHPADGQALLTFRYPGDKSETLVLIDTKRNVVLSIETRNDGKTTATQQFSDFTQAAGAWWAGKIESRNAKGHVMSVTRQNIVRLAAARFSQSMTGELAGRAEVQFLHDPGQTLIEAKKALAAGKATFDDQITLLLHFARSGQWTRAMDHLAAAEKLAAGKAGVRWLRYAVLKSARRNEELKNLFQREAAALVVPPLGGPRAIPPGHHVPMVGGTTNRTDDLYLANYLLGQAGGVLEANETLAELDALRAVFARQPAHLQAMKSWKQQRAGALANAGRGDEALATYKELALAYPHDIGTQESYIQNLQNRQECDALRKWIDHLLSSDTPWEPGEIEQLHSYYSQSLRGQERYEELVSYLARYLEQNPESADPYQQYLDALFYTERFSEADNLMDRWFKEGRREDVGPAAAAKLQAAVNWIFNQSDRYNGQRIVDPRWQDQLVATAEFFCQHKTQVSISERIANDWRFQQTEANHKLRLKLAKVFAEHFDRLTLDQINRFVSWLRGDDSLVKPEEWKSYAGRLLARYAAKDDSSRSDKEAQLAVEEFKNQLALAAAQIVSFSTGPDEYMALLRRLSHEAPEKYRPYYIQQLFQTLGNQPWSEKNENELFELLGQLGGNESPEQKLATHIRALHGLTDSLLRGRVAAKAKTLEHAEKLTRKEQLKKQADNLRAAREEVAQRLAREESKHGGDLAVWIAAERMYLDVLLNRNLDKVAEGCWKVLDAPQPKIDESADEAAIVRAELDLALRNRCLVTLLNLAARKNADPALVRRMLGYVDANIARAVAAQSDNQAWRLLKFELLVALDKPKELQSAIDDWIKAGDADNRWQVALGYLLAEQGNLADAIKRFEGVAAADELGPAEWRTLADWYQAVSRRNDYERAKIEIYKTMDEWRLDQWLRAQMQPWVNNQGPLPSQLDPEVVLAFRALFAKSANPQNYIGYQLNELYKASRDFRLLSCLADSISGHTAEQIYPYLQAAQSTIAEIREEAAVDSLTEHIHELRDKAASDVDRRAFDLLEAMTERRAAELRNQPGPHVDKAVAALQRAFQRQWSSGEEWLMADFLAALGAIPQEKLAVEQLRQLEAFYARSKPDSQQRLDMAGAWARALWSYNRRKPAMDLLESEINRYAASFSPRPYSGEGQGVRAFWKPLCEQPVFQLYVSYLDQAGQFREAVDILQQQLQQAEKTQNRRDLDARIVEVELSALRRRGQVGDLKGQELYRSVQKHVLEELPTGDAAFDARLIVLLSSLYGEAHNLGIAGATADTKSFAFETLPRLLKHQVQQYENLVNDLCERVRQVCGPDQGIAFLLDRYERQPQWLKIRNNFWNSHGGRLNNWRREAKTLAPALSDRLLKLVLDYLHDELLIRRTYNMTICYKSYPGEFWSEREADFLRFAEDIYAHNKTSGAIICNVADYLAQGLDRHGRAIEILQAAQQEKLLDEGGQWKLVDYVHAFNRFGESISLLQDLVKNHPDHLGYRRSLMYAYFRTNRKDDLLGLLKQTDAYFHQDNRWGEAPPAMLAGICSQTELFEQSVAYYKELIPLHERTAPNRGIGDGTLSGYYSGEAGAYAGLKKTPEAVEAACAAIISWGTNMQNRAQALESLKNVLRGSEKLDSYVVELDAKTAKTGSDNPLVRKALGQVYSERGQYDKAVTQLRTACELEPNDAEIHQALVACCDKQNDKRGAIRQLLASVQLSRRDINLYKEMGRRLAELHEDREAERAYTSIVEVLASESESHAMLAEIREAQNRWPEAIDQWRQVARLRALEPTGLLRLGAAQLHEWEWAAAAETVRQLRARTWPPRFGNMDYQIQELERKIRK
jgi:predicted Zn-dependent protease